MSPSAPAIPKDTPAVAIPQQSPCRILAIDYGRRKIGLAISDLLALTAQPLATFERKNRRDDMRRLREICAEHHIGRILVGHPLRLSGEAGEMAQEASQFAARLRKELGIEVELVDERLTSWESQQITAERKSSFSRSRRAPRRSRSQRQNMDHVAAAVLLRDYLDRHRAGDSSSGLIPAPAERA